MQSYFTKIKRIVLHIGPDKTGSTVIQRSLKDNQEFFQLNGVFYSTDCSHNDKCLFLWFCSDSDWASVVVSSSASRYLKSIEMYKEAFQERVEQFTPDATWVLSFEGLIYLQENDLEGLRDFLLQYAHDVKILFYVRDALSYAISAKSQRVKTGRRSSWNKPLYIHYGKVLPKFVKVFGLENIEARQFDGDTLKCGDVVLDFVNANWSEGVFSEVQKPFETSFDRNFSLDADSYLLLQSLGQILHGGDLASNEFKKQFAHLGTHQAGLALKLSPLEAVLVLIASAKHFSYIKETFGVKPNTSMKRHVGFSLCRHFAREMRAQSIIVNEFDSENLGVVSRLWRLFKALIHDGLLLPVCFARLIQNKGFSIK